jgi:hypothetical protein
VTRRLRQRLAAVLVCLFFAAAASAQSLRVVSEFQRYGPFGEVLPIDRVDQPREILSPALARNAYTSFRIVVNIPAETPYFLYVQSNPANLFEMTLYKEIYIKAGEQWIPDVLEETKIPTFGMLPYPPSPILGQNTVSYWLDLRVPADAPVRRARLEVLMKVGNRWVIYPMEVRIVEANVPAIRSTGAKLPPLAERADSPVNGPLGVYLCRGKESAAKEPLLTARALIRRNGLQDMALAQALEGKLGRGAITAEILRRAGLTNAQDWCRAHPTASELGAEWYLRVRDWLYRQSEP